jgi:putative ABC transport system permease protein
MTTPFTQPDHQALRQTGDVAAVRAYRGEFLDMAGRRVWIMARPPNDRTLIPPTQIKKGNIDTATRRIRSDGWAALSASIADGLHVGVGDAFTLPTPIGPRRLRVAAVVSNLGWAPGSLVLNGHDYRRWWPGSDVTALEVDLRPGVAPAAGKAAIQHALPAGTPLLVETQTERKQRFGRLERQGLNRLTQISTLLLIASILAVAAAMVGTVWQQRPRLAALRMHGYSVGRVLRVLITQATLVLAPGALIGALFGLYGQVLGTRWLTTATGFPTNVSVSFTLAILTVTGVAVLATIVISIPGYVAARTEPSVACKVE